MILIIKCVSEKHSISIFDLYKNVSNSIQLPDFLDAVCCLYAIDKIDYDSNTKIINYVDRNKV